MTITLTNQESEDIFHSSLCNGLNYFLGYGFQFLYDTNIYANVKEELISGPHFATKEIGNNRICYEDILMEMLRKGHPLIFINDDKDEYPVTIKDVHERVEKVPIRTLFNFVNQEDDAEDADIVFQYVLFNKILLA